MTTKEFNTDDKLEYTFHTVTSGALHFEVKAPHDAHVALTTGPEETDNMYEVFLGGWDNNKSAIRRNREKPDKVDTETPSLLSADESKKFWIRWDDGQISVGKGGEDAPFLSWTDPEPFPISHFGVRTAWGSEGVWKVEDGPELATPNSKAYHYRPILAGSLEISVKCQHDAHIALCNGPAETDPMYEVFFGAWNNTASAIRYRRETPDKAKVDTPDIMCDGEHKKFWIRWNHGQLNVSRDGEGEAFLSWLDPEPFPITHYGIRTGWGAQGHWMVKEGDPGCCAPAATGSATWVDVSGGELPEGAVKGGHDHECDIYVGRAEHEGALLPGKVVPAHGVCYVPWGGEEHGKEQYQVLVGCEPEWVASSGGEVVEGALAAGRTLEGETLYVGRVEHEGTVTVGKVHPSHATCYIAYGGAEQGFPEYEILVVKS